MKNLIQFLIFNIIAFLKGKILVVTGISDWKDYQSGVLLGKKIEVVITKDDTEYRQKPGQTITNIYEKMVIKVPSSAKLPRMGDQIELVNPSATVYGDYRNLLSIKADDIKVVPAPAASHS